MNTNLEQAVLDYKRREAMIAEFKRVADENITPLQLAQKRILELETERDETYREYAEMIRDLQGYFPDATGMHAVYKGIEALEAQRDKLVAELAALAVQK